MTTFDVRRIWDFETIQPVHKIVRNGKCLLDDFVARIESDRNLAPELGDLFAVVEDIANRRLNPKYRKLHLSKRLRYSGYEAKSRHLRLYLFHEKDSGQILIFGGKKGEQDEDIRRFEKIIHEYTTFKSRKK